MAENKTSDPALCAELELKSAIHNEELLSIIAEYCYINEIEFETFAETIATPNLIQKLADEQISLGRLSRNKRMRNLLLKLRCKVPEEEAPLDLEAMCEGEDEEDEGED